MVLEGFELLILYHPHTWKAGGKSGQSAAQMVQRITREKRKPALDLDFMPKFDDPWYT